MKTLVSGCIAEFFGAFALMFVGGAAMINVGEQNFANPGLALLVVALAHGLILAVAVSATLHISGGQFNPAVSIALGLIKKQGWGRAGAFVVAQLGGAVAAAALLAAAFPMHAVLLVRHGATIGTLTAGDPRDPTASGDPVMVLTLEVIATFTLMMVILGAAVDRRGVAKSASTSGLCIGLCVSALILAIGPLTGASMNPCRSFGPALVGGHWEMHWAYWVAPIVGAGIATLVWYLLMGGRDSESASD